MRGIQLAERIGLELKQCKSSIERVDCDISLPSVEALFASKLHEPSTMIVWQIHRLDWCRVLEGRIVSTEELNVEAWLELRAFNADEEIHLKRAGDRFVGRYVVDELGDENYFVDSFARLWGERVGASDGYVRLKDASRKLEMNVPCDAGDADWYGLLTRNYIGSDRETGLSGYVDYRFVSIESAKGGADRG